MKTQIFSLMLSVTVMTTSPLFAMDRDGESSSALARAQRPSLNNKELTWIIESANNGIPSCEHYLGTLFERGEGVPQNYRQAAHYYKKAAERSTLPDPEVPCSNLINSDELVAHVYQYLGDKNSYKSGEPDFQRAIYWYEQSLKLDGPSGRVGRFVSVAKYGLTMPLGEQAQGPKDEQAQGPND